MKASKDYMSNMFGQYTPARYSVSNGDPVKKSKDAVDPNSCGRGSTECGAYKSGGTNKAKSTMSKSAQQSKKSRSNFGKSKHNLRGRIVTKGNS